MHFDIVLKIIYKNNKILKSEIQFKLFRRHCSKADHSIFLAFLSDVTDIVNVKRVSVKFMVIIYFFILKLNTYNIVEKFCIIAKFIQLFNRVRV